MDRRTDNHTDKWTDRQDRHTGKGTDRQMDRQTWQACADNRKESW